MAAVQQFEDLKVWQEAKLLAKAVYQMTRIGALAKDFGLRDQLQRAAVSIMSNVAEGFERGTNREFVQFLHIAKGSAGEVRSLLLLCHDLGYLEEPSFTEIHAVSLTVSRRLSAFIKYLQGRRTSPKPALPPDNLTT